MLIIALYIGKVNLFFVRSDKKYKKYRRKLLTVASIFGYNKKEAEELSEPAQAAQILPLSLFKAGSYRLMY
jgi:hypothetical protein